MLNLILRRLAVTFFELFGEAVFLGALFWLALLPGAQECLTLSLALGVLLVSPAPVILVLYLWGYYFTRPAIGLFLRARETWVYGAVAAGLFAIHMSIAICGMRKDFTRQARVATAPFLIGGAVVVFCCALYGDYFLRRWVCSRNLPIESLPWEKGVLRNIFLNKTSRSGR